MSLSGFNSMDLGGQVRMFSISKKVPKKTRLLEFYLCNTGYVIFTCCSETKLRILP